MHWQARKGWSDRFVPQIQRILGEHLIRPAGVADDTLRNTDLITLELPGETRIACRVRRHEYLAQYADEFTLRCSVVSGRDTEIDKLLAGWGDYLFYGFANQSETDLAAWLIGDLQVFRDWFARTVQRDGDYPCRLRTNRDGGSSFAAFKIADIDRDFVVARQHAVHALAA